MNVSPDLDPIDLNGELFIHGPSDEPLEVSRRRLENTITGDGVFDYIGAAALWYTYRHHPELSEAIRR